MKLSSQKKLNPILAMLVAGIVTLSHLTSQAQAEVIWTFNQVGDDLVATASGSFSIDITEDNLGDPSGETEYLIGGPYAYVLTKNSADFSYSSLELAGFSTPFDVYHQPDYGSGTFGWIATELRWDYSLGETLMAGTDISGGAAGVPSLTWSNRTVDDVFDDNFFDSGEGMNVWSLIGGGATDNISLVLGSSSVPELSSTCLLGLGAMGLLLRRKR